MVRIASVLALAASYSGVCAAASGPIVLIASPDGKGKSCSRTVPCSLAMAQVAARAATPSMAADIRVQLLPGEYRLREPLVLTGADSGRNGFTVIYEPAAIGEVRISGSQPATGLGRIGGQVQADGPRGVIPRQLYADGIRMRRARFPDTGYVRGLGWDEATMAVTFSSPPPAVRDLANVELVANRHWQQHRVRLAGPVRLGTDGSTTIGLRADDSFISFNAPGGTIAKNQPYYLENAPEFLDAPGEWLVDERTGRIRIIPSGAGRVARIDVPVLQTLIRLQGTESMPVHDVTIRGLTFEYTSWDEPSRNGLVPVQTTWLSTPDGIRYVPGAVEVRGIGAARLRFERNVFRHLGDVGPGAV